MTLRNPRCNDKDEDSIFGTVKKTDKGALRNL